MDATPKFELFGGSLNTETAWFVLTAQTSTPAASTQFTVNFLGCLKYVELEFGVGMMRGYKKHWDSIRY
jgi:hypothetical protein